MIIAVHTGFNNGKAISSAILTGYNGRSGCDSCDNVRVSRFDILDVCRSDRVFASFGDFNCFGGAGNNQLNISDKIRMAAQINNMAVSRG